MSLGQSLNISVDSMKNNQYALAVVSHNIANLNTEGYVKQAVHFTEDRIDTYGNDVLSIIKGLNGADIASIEDYLDDAAMRDVINSNANAQYYNTLADAIGGLEDIADALGDNGLNKLLNDFYAAAANLEQHPTDITIRQQYLLAAQNVCDKFNEVSKSCDDLQEQTQDSTIDNVAIVNKLFEDLAQANNQYLASGKSSSALADIYSVLQDLSNYIDVTTETNRNGTINLYVGSTKVVQGSKVNFTLEAEKNTQDGKALNLTLQSTEDKNVVINGINDAIKGGKIAAQLEFVNDTSAYMTVSGIKGYLDQAANAFATALNEVQLYESEDGSVFAASLTDDGKGGNILEKSTVKMFTAGDDDTGEINAANIKVNSLMIENPKYIATARIDLNEYTQEEIDNESWRNAIGNSTNATEITQVQNKKLCMFGGINCTISDFLASVQAKNGMDAGGLDSKSDLYQSIADKAKTNYIDLTGVNLDEELADMIKYQRAYEASAKLFATVNGLYDVILSMV